MGQRDSQEEHFQRAAGGLSPASHRSCISHRDLPTNQFILLRFVSRLTVFTLHWVLRTANTHHVGLAGINVNTAHCAECDKAKPCVNITSGRRLYWEE